MAPVLAAPPNRVARHYDIATPDGTPLGSGKANGEGHLPASSSPRRPTANGLPSPPPTAPAPSVSPPTTAQAPDITAPG
ncbi:hypothetical protein KCP77_08130 [Salmonella enterica subsp. enterica]|nr:hypothetical protein KCP77_08130 [Salmonella enterica subsp. enterica]